MSIQHRHAIAWAVCGGVVLGAAACSSSASSDSMGTRVIEVPAKAGSVSVSNSKSSFSGYTASAAFYYGSEAAASSCAVTVENNCTIQQCDISPAVDAGADGDGGISKEVGAGIIRIRGGSTDVALDVLANNLYPVLDRSGLLWSGGERMTVTAAGDPNGCGPFSATLVAPSFVTFESPNLAASGLPVDRAKDLPLAWSTAGPPAGNVAAALRSLVSNAKTVSAICQYPAEDRKGLVPASVLGKFPEGSGSLSVSGISESIQTTGDWQITVSLYANGGSQEAANSANIVFR